MWEIVEYKGVKIRHTDSNTWVVHDKKGFKQVTFFKSITSAKRWITSNKTYRIGVIQVAGRCLIDQYKDTKFY